MRHKKQGSKICHTHDRKPKHNPIFYITQYCIPCSPYPSPGLTPRVNPGVLKVIFHQNWVLGWNFHKIDTIHAAWKSKDPKVCHTWERKGGIPEQLWKELDFYPVWLTMMTMSYMHPGDLCHLYFEVLPRKYQYWDSRQVLPYPFQNLSKQVKLISTQILSLTHLLSRMELWPEFFL